MTRMGVLLGLYGGAYPSRPAVEEETPDDGPKGQPMERGGVTADGRMASARLSIGCMERRLELLRRGVNDAERRSAACQRSIDEAEEACERAGDGVDAARRSLEDIRNGAGGE